MAWSRESRARAGRLLGTAGLVAGVAVGTVLCLALVLMLWSVIGTGTDRDAGTRAARAAGIADASRGYSGGTVSELRHGLVADSTDGASAVAVVAGGTVPATTELRTYPGGDGRDYVVRVLRVPAGDAGLLAIASAMASAD